MRYQVARIYGLHKKKLYPQDRIRIDATELKLFKTGGKTCILLISVCPGVNRSAVWDRGCMYPADTMPCSLIFQFMGLFQLKIDSLLHYRQWFSGLDLP